MARAVLPHLGAQERWLLWGAVDAALGELGDLPPLTELPAVLEALRVCEPEARGVGGDAVV